MDPPECSGHSHDHMEHGDDLGLSLRPQIDLPAVRCLNEEIPNSGRAVIKLHEERLSPEPCLRSQPDDPELLLHIPFTENVTIQSIAIRSVVLVDNDNNNNNHNPEACPPKTIKLFVNREDLDFETVREMQPEAKLELLPPHHFVEGTIDYPLRPAGRFQNVSSLTMFVADNHCGDDEDEEEVSTIITFVGLKGKGTKQRRQAVETVYEARGMPKDHKVKGEFGNQQFL